MTAINPVVRALALAMLLVAACGGGDTLYLGPLCGSDDAGAADAAPDAGDPGAHYQDEFEGTALDPSWQRTRAALLDISVEGGELHLEPNQYSVWFHAEVGAALSKPVTGDFRVTTSVKARKRSD